MTWSCVAISQEVSPPVGTSEYPRLKYAVLAGETETGDAEKFVNE